MFGGPLPQSGRLDPEADVRVSVRAEVDPEYGWFHVDEREFTPFDGREFSFSLSEERNVFRTVEPAEEGWTCLARRGESYPTFAFHGPDCLFPLASGWPRAVNWYLFWRLLRLRPDAIFFHASAMGIHGKGTIFVGPSGGGKSTTALALAARGHLFLSDEVAGYLPATGELIPFRRPVGIKPGPRARAVAQALPAHEARRIEEIGFTRVDIETLFPGASAPSPPLPLGRIVFLRGFRAHPEMSRIQPGREEIAELQPLMSSFVNESHRRRVFDLVHLLAAARVYELHPGDPDETANHIQEVLARE
jgi:hypothetical protein